MINTALLCSCCVVILFRVFVDTINPKEEWLIIPRINFHQFKLDFDLVMRGKHEHFLHRWICSENIVATEKSNATTSRDNILAIGVCYGPSFSSCESVASQVWIKEGFGGTIIFRV